ncbi:MAG: hypothetical protein FD167_4235, partial [bacterium]
FAKLRQDFTTLLKLVTGCYNCAISSDKTPELDYN